MQTLLQALRTRQEKIHAAAEKMDAKMKIFAFLLFFCVCNRGDAMCSLSDLAVHQTTAPEKVGGYHTHYYYVTVANGCICTQTHVKLACPGFNSSVPIEPAGVVRRDDDGADGEVCTLNAGGPVRNGDVIRFYYQWSSMFSFAPVSSSIACS